MNLACWRPSAAHHLFELLEVDAAVAVVAKISTAAHARLSSQCACLPGRRGVEARPRAQAAAEAVEEEAPRFRWDELGSGLSESQEQAMRVLSHKLPNRCRALMPRVVCLSPRDENLGVVLAFWVKAMKPKRAEWLLVFQGADCYGQPSSC